MGQGGDSSAQWQKQRVVEGFALSMWQQEGSYNMEAVCGREAWEPPQHATSMVCDLCCVRSLAALKLDSPVLNKCQVSKHSQQLPLKHSKLLNNPQ